MLNNKTVDLLPCPFCGQSDAFVERADYSSAYVQCDGDVGDGCSCQARGPIAVQDDDGEEIPGGAGAVRNWNRRAAAAAPVVASGDLMRDKFGEWYKRQFGYDLGSDFDNDDGMQARHWATWQAALAAAPASPAAPVAPADTCAQMRALCSACGGTGDVTSITGEWRGYCDCEASRAAPVAQPADIKTWQERASAASPLSHPDELEFRAKFHFAEKEIAALRARLSATPAAPLAQQSEPVAWLHKSPDGNRRNVSFQQVIPRDPHEPVDPYAGWTAHALVYAGSAPASPVPASITNARVTGGDVEGNRVFVNMDERPSTELWTTGTRCYVALAAPASTGPCSDDTAKDAATADAARDVLAERRRQVEKEGWAPAHDDQYTKQELRWAAICYVRAADFKPGAWPASWPWAADWWKPSTDRRNLVKAGALILAEIERIDRAALSAAEQGGKA